MVHAHDQVQEKLVIPDGQVNKIIQEIIQHPEGGRIKSVPLLFFDQCSEPMF